MKSLLPALAAHLASGVTTLCWCWRLVRRDGLVLGFTEHDRDVVFGGTTYEAAGGFTASDMKDSLGLSVANLDVTGALASERLSEADLTAGKFDDASVEIYRVNWQAPEQHVLMRTGSLGDVKRSGAMFSAEVRGLAHYLQQPGGRLYQFACDADLGDARCGIDLDLAAYRASGGVLAVASRRRFTATGLSTFALAWFERGLLVFTSGAVAGQAIEVKYHGLALGVVTLELWGEAAADLAPGVTFTVTAGCDKRLQTCRTKFANAVNFRGFPAMPGNDFVARVARPAGA